MTNITTGARRCETYAGMFLHQASGLYLTQYRAYDPFSGRWLSRDPLGELSGIAEFYLGSGINGNWIETNPESIFKTSSFLSRNLAPSSTQPLVERPDVTSDAALLLDLDASHGLTGDNLYSYVMGDPINNVDHKGLCGLRPSGPAPGQSCHEYCVEMTVGRGLGSQAPQEYWRCMNECEE